jgi:hypothetical protein
MEEEMTRTRIFTLCFILIAAAAAFAEPEKGATAPGFDADACAKHCKDMAAAKQKMMDEHKAMMDKHAAAWKEIQASLDEAKKSKGDKKVAALETAVEKLVAFHESMMSKMGGGPMGHAMMPGCGGMGHPMGDRHDMHGKMGGMMDCCAGHGMHHDCPMMNND